MKMNLSEAVLTCSPGSARAACVFLPGPGCMRPAGPREELSGDQESNRKNILIFSQDFSQTINSLRKVGGKTHTRK